MLIIAIILYSAVELAPEPSWESADTDYCTGGILADIDADGDLDLVTGNGNDMARNPNKVYYNADDMLEETASWVSDNLACHGHISLGDIDADGDLDLCAAGFAYHSGWVSDPTVVYKNDDGRYTQNPVWSGADELHVFSCDWGDADADGDLDLALAAGNDYIDLKQKVVIFENLGGNLSSEPMWESADEEYNMDVCWADVDSDGDIDLAVAGYINRLYICEEGTLNTQPSWKCADSNATIQIAFADFEKDGDLDMLTASNNQFGANRPGESRVRIYRNNDGELTTTPYWESKLWSNQSCVAWGDVDGDGDLDIAAGGWWEPLSVYENKNGSFDADPNWTWTPGSGSSLVCEQVIWAEVNNDNWTMETEDFGFLESGDVVYPSVMPILDVVEVKIGGSAATTADYLWNPASSWIQINKPGGVEVTYRYSKYPDLLVTNWNAPTGNFLFLNEAGDTNVIAENPSQGFPDVRLEKTVYRQGEKVLLLTEQELQIKEVALYDITGRRIRASIQHLSSNGFELETSELIRGIYMLQVKTQQGQVNFKLQVM
ncbi:T9SS type A sorting domain-containing protein [candidate division WOR-3 bacterium]|nr:T9SS type A sorting domain-containing protein [candidate division WOR-3 bacterium]